MFPRLLLVPTSTVAAALTGVVGDLDDVFEPPPHAASDTVVRPVAATRMSGVMRLVMAISAPVQIDGSGYRSSVTVHRRNRDAGDRTDGSEPRQVDRRAIDLAV